MFTTWQMWETQAQGQPSRSWDELSHWKISFQKQKVWMCRQHCHSSHACGKLGFPHPWILTAVQMPHFPRLVLFPWLWIMQWLLKTCLNPSLRPKESYSLSFEQSHAYSPPTFGSHCHSCWNFLQNIYVLTPFHPPSKAQFEFYFVVLPQTFNSWMSHILETSPNWLSVSGGILWVLILLDYVFIFHSALPFGISSGYGLFSQLSCKKVCVCATLLDLESALRSHSGDQTVQ